MTTKTFRAETIMDALQLVQEEFGPEAIVLSVREVPVGPTWQVWRQPGCEVIAESGSPKHSPTDCKEVSRGGDQDSSRNAQLPDGVEWIDEPLPNRSPTGCKEVSRGRAPQIVRSTSSDAPAVTPKSAAKPWSPPKVDLPTAGIALHGEQAAPAKTKPETQENSAPAGTDLTPRKAMPTATPSPKGEGSIEAPLPLGRGGGVGAVQAQSPVTDARPTKISETLSRFQQRLTAQGVDAELVERILATCAQSFSPASMKDQARVQAYLQRQLESLLKVQSRALMETPGKVICLVGPSGSGKTTACARLAAYYGARGKRVAWVSVDTVRAGAIAEARSFVEALGIALHVAYTPEELTWKLEAAAEADLIVVDTPGYNPRNEAQMAELGGYLTQMPERSTYLLAPAPTKESDLGQIYAALKPFKLRGLVLTKLDETLTLGSLYNFAWRSQLPLAYVTSGKAVLDDFAPANASRLVAALFGGN